MKKRYFFIFFPALFFLAQSSCAQNKDTKKNPAQDSPSGKQLSLQKKWVDSVYQSLNQQERIGQLFMVAAYSGGPNENSAVIEQLIARHQIGGVIFMQGTPKAQAVLTNKYQKNAQVPLFIGMDAEWGLGMRLTGVTDYPKQMTLGATKDSALVYEMGKEIARQCQRLGVHINFAPVVDINNNPQNPIINFRSFGENKNLVSKLGIAYMKGLQDHGIMACAKHFPGHGDVSVDSHQDLPVIKKSKKELENLELFPFQQLIDAGLKSMMIAHLSVPSLDNTAHLPSTLSKKIVTDLLIHEMGFKGLIFTDALNMKGVTKYFPDGETDLQAYLAGNDVLLFSQNVPLAITKIKNALDSGKTSEEELEYRVKKILAAKYDAGLYHFQEIKTENIDEDLNSGTASFKEKVANSSITLLKDKNNLLEKLKHSNSKIGYLSLNNSGNDALEKDLNIHFTNLRKSIGNSDDLDVLIVSVQSNATYPGRNATYGLDAGQIKQITDLSKKKNVLFVILGNAYLSKYVCDASTVLLGYENNPYVQKAAAAVIQGKLIPKGSLPVHVCP